MKDMHQFDLDPRRHAANAMLLGIFDALGDTAGRFTCSEMEQIVEAYRAFGYGEEAEILMTMHAQGDDDYDDLHEVILKKSEYGDFKVAAGWKYREHEED